MNTDLDLNYIKNLIDKTLALEDAINSAIKYADDKPDLNPNLKIMFNAYKETIDLQKKEIKLLLEAIRNDKLEEVNYHINKITSFSKFIKEDSTDLIKSIFK